MPTYGADGDKVTGHVTIKSPGLIKCYIQNLKKPKDNMEYIFCLMSKGKNRGVKIGNVGEEKETRWLVNQNNINGSGLKLEDIDGMAVVMDAKNKAPETVLLGFVKDRYQVYHIIDELFPRPQELDKLTPITNKEKKAFTDNINNKIQKQIDKEFEQEASQVPMPIILDSIDEATDSYPPEDYSQYEDKAKQYIKEEVKQDMKKNIKEDIKQDAKEGIKQEIKEAIADILKNELSNNVNITDRDISKPEEEEIKNLGGFILPKDAKVAPINCDCKQENVNTVKSDRQIDSDSIDAELKRIIDTISKDKRLEKKARELQEQILKLRHIGEQETTVDSGVEEKDNDRYSDEDSNYKEGNADYSDLKDDKENDADTEDTQMDSSNESMYDDEEETCNVCPAYTAQKLNIEEATQENEVSDNTQPPSSPHDALSYIANMEYVPEEDVINESDDELKYLRKMDDKLKEIRSRIEKGIEALDSNTEMK